MWRLRLHPEAVVEGVNARARIGDDDFLQGEIFADTLEASFKMIKLSPMIYRCFDREFRRVKVGKFNYSVIFRIVGD